MDSAYDFEREFVHQVCRLADERGMNHTHLAKAAFGDKSSSVVKWRHTRNPRGQTGKPQAITLSEAVHLAEAVGVDFASLAFRAQEALKLRRRRQEIPEPYSTASEDAPALAAAEAPAPFTTTPKGRKKS